MVPGLSHHPDLKLFNPVIFQSGLDPDDFKLFRLTLILRFNQAYTVHKSAANSDRAHIIVRITGRNHREPAAGFDDSVPIEQLILTSAGTVLKGCLR